MQQNELISTHQYLTELQTCLTDGLITYPGTVLPKSERKPMVVTILLDFHSLCQQQPIKMRCRVQVELRQAAGCVKALFT